MLRYKRITTATITDGTETLAEILSGVTGKKYTIVSITSAPLADMYLRVYRNAEQVVDVATIAMTTGFPLLPMDLPVEIGQIVRVGFYNNGAATTAKQITIGYKDS